MKPYLLVIVTVVLALVLGGLGGGVIASQSYSSELSTVQSQNAELRKESETLQQRTDELQHQVESMNALEGERFERAKKLVNGSWILT